MLNYSVMFTAFLFDDEGNILDDIPVRMVETKDKSEILLAFNDFVSELRGEV